MRRIVVFHVALAAALLAPVLLAPPAQATVSAPIDVSVPGGPVAALAGQPFAGTFEIHAFRSIDLSNIRLQGQGWSVQFTDLPSQVHLEADERLLVQFQATPQDVSVPLEVAMDWNGGSDVEYLYFSPDAVEHERTPGATLPAPQGMGGQAPGARTMLRPDAFAEAPDPGAEPLRRLPGEPRAAAARDIRVHGRFTYTRSDGTTLGADGVTVSVYDEDTFSDTRLASDATDAGGYYDITFTWDPCGLCDGQPDIYLRFRCANGRTAVRWTGLGVDWQWKTATTADYAGTDLDYGSLQPAKPAEHGAVHILTDLTRTWRWLDTIEGFDTPFVYAKWPDGPTGASYNDGDRRIRVGADRTWREDTHSHEYGHHWIYTFAVGQEPAYCNGLCDLVGQPCGHCLWCPETDHDAWNEGWPDWLADVLTRSYAGDYGVASMFFRDMEALGTCGGGVADDPVKTEGFLGALLRDIEDSAQDDNSPVDPYMDALSLGTHQIFTTTDLDGPLTPLDFLAKFKVRYPTLKEKLWETAHNVGYETDAAAPGAPTALTSTDHIAGFDSPDPTIDLTWTRASDDASGILGYSVSVTPAPAMPPEFYNVLDVTAYTTPILAPGSYFVNVRAVDRAQHWGTTYASAGPFIIRTPEPSNLAFINPLDWDNVLVPRASADATVVTCHYSPSLPGNAAGTYWNVSAINNGESATSAGSETHLLLDGSDTGSALISPSVAAGANLMGINLGSQTVRGGRHTFEARLDDTDLLAETSETDNRWADQFVWTPLAIPADAVVTRPPPPSATGGWDSVFDGSPLYYNCDGLRFTAIGWWNAVSVWSTDLAVDDDCRLYRPSSGATNGFAVPSALSVRGEGRLDAVIVNTRYVANAGDWDVGVAKYSGTTGYAARHSTSSSLALGTPTLIPMGPDDYVLLREVQVEMSGPVSVTVDVTPAYSRVYASWLHKDFSTGGLLDYSAQAVTNSAGRARLDLVVASPGFYCLVLYRDPKDSAGPPPAALAARETPGPIVSAPSITLEVTVKTTPPDLVPALAAGWYAPLVPRPAADGAPNGVAEPDTLPGYASTYFNVAVGNQGPTAAGGFAGTVTLDGMDLFSIFYGNLAANGTDLFNGGDPWIIRGGRHTVGLRLDPAGAIEEIDDDNNAFGEQYAWSPLTVAPGAPVTLPAPPEPTGGWAEAANGGPLWLNCDGLRTPAFSQQEGRWAAVAVMSGPSSDVDVQLHEALAGAKDGFADGLAFSGWGLGQSDYVLVDFHRAEYRAFDAGIVSAGGSDDFSAEVVTSDDLGADPEGTLGPFVLGAGRILDVHGVYLSAGVVRITLEALGGPVDWGLTLHPADGVYLSKSSVVPSGVAWLNGTDQDEQVAVTLTDAGDYAVAVWKATSADLPAAGQYRLRFERGAVDVAGGEAPGRTSLASIWPNPLRDGATIRFDLAAEQDVKLGVYDVSGSLVRSLAAGSRPAGRFSSHWDRTGPGGRRVPAGVYLVRMSCPSYAGARKVVVLE